MTGAYFCFSASRSAIAQFSLVSVADWVGRADVNGCCGPCVHPGIRRQSAPVEMLRGLELSEKLLRHGSHAAGGSGLSVGSKVLDDHGKDGGEGCGDDLRGDSGLLCCLFDEAGTAKTLSYLLRSCCGVLS